MKWRTRLRRYVMWERHRLRMAGLRRSHELRYLFLEVTRRCNLSCKYCGSSCTPREQGAELSAEQWCEIIAQVAKDFDARRIMVAVTGGEPLMKKGLFEILQTLRQHRFRYGLVSNGSLLDAEAARRLVAAGMGSISLSMDAPPALNDALRGEGSSAKVLTAIGHLRAAAFRGKLEIISTITKPAVATLDEMRAFIAQQGINLWRVAPVMPVGRALEHPDLLPDARDVRAILEFVRAGRRDKTFPVPEFSEDGFVGARFEGVVRPYLCQCRAGVSIAGIRANGRIGACPELPECFDQGDIHQERLKEVWDQRYQVFRDRRWTRKGVCGTCKHYRVCNGGALHLYQDTSSEALRCMYLMCKEAEQT